MKIDKISEKTNPLRKRKEYWLLADHAGKGTPSRHGLISEVAKALGAKEEAMVLDKVFSERGAAKSKVKVHVYSDKKDVPKEKLARHERKVKAFLEKNSAKEAEKKEAEAAAAPAEEKIEEPPAEEKAEEGEAPTAEKQGAPAEEAPAEDAPAEEKKD